MASKNKNKCVFEKQVVLFLVTAPARLREFAIWLSAEKATFQRETMRDAFQRETITDVRGSSAIRVHPELGGRTLDMGHSLTSSRRQQMRRSAFHVLRGMAIRSNSRSKQVHSYFTTSLADIHYSELLSSLHILPRFDLTLSRKSSQLF